MKGSPAARDESNDRRGIRMRSPASAMGCPNLIQPTNEMFDVDCGDLFDYVLQAIQAGR